MKRKLVEYEVFEKMRENSLTTAVKELIEAEEHLARALEIDDLKLSSFDESTVIYESADGNYIRANYDVDSKNVSFDNVEQLVINEESEKEEGRKILRSMLESILDDKAVDAAKCFEQYMTLQSRRYQRENAEDTGEILEEGYARLYGSPARTKGKSTPVISRRTGSKNPKKVMAGRNSWRGAGRVKHLMGIKKRKRNLTKERARRKKYSTVHNKLRALNTGKSYNGTRKKMNEWLNLSNNVYGYVEFVNNHHVISETKVVKNDNGSLAVSLPNSKLRNEAKLLKMHYDNMLKTDVKVLREAARRLVHDRNFCSLVADVKRYNNISDNKELEESISNLVSKFPSVLYLTQEELAQVVSLALDTAGVNNYDDQICRFMAEGILRVAHGAYVERVERIKKLANKSDLTESDDKYLDFQKVVSEFFPTLDESTQLEMKMFEDLYNVAVDIRRLALESQNDVVRNEASEFAAELEAVLQGKAMPSLELAADVADWLEDLAEGNIPGSSETWNVVKTAHKTVTGDHPQMAKNAKVDGVPSKYHGDYGDEAPMIGQDSMAWNHGDEARNRSWANKGGKDTWPTLSNPHVPAPFGDYKMKGEKSVEDDDDGFATWGDGDTWPNLQNPYIPKAVMPKQNVQPDNPVE